MQEADVWPGQPKVDQSLENQPDRRVDGIGHFQSAGNNKIALVDKASNCVRLIVLPAFSAWAQQAATVSKRLVSVSRVDSVFLRVSSGLKYLRTMLGGMICCRTVKSSRIMITSWRFQWLACLMRCRMTHSRIRLPARAKYGWVLFSSGTNSLATALAWLGSVILGPCPRQNPAGRWRRRVGPVPSAQYQEYS